jgi:hypothetical protein
LSIKRGKLKWQNESVKLSQNKNEENHVVLGGSKCVSKAFSPQRWRFPYLKVLLQFHPVIFVVVPKGVAAVFFLI